MLLFGIHLVLVSRLGINKLEIWGKKNVFTIALMHQRMISRSIISKNSFRNVYWFYLISLFPGATECLLIINQNVRCIDHVNAT